MSPPLQLTPGEVRRVAIERQRLGGSTDRLGDPPQGPTRGTIVDLARELGAFQLDTASPVAPNPRLVLFSRLGAFDARMLDRSLWHDRTLFEYFAHAASIVPASDFPIHRTLMRSWATGDSAWDRRVQAWMEANEPLRAAILARLAIDGPLRTGDFPFVAGPPWQSTAWPIARNVERMLEFLWIRGVIVPAGHWRSQRVWQLMERWLPDEVAAHQPPPDATTRDAVERSLRSLGAATARHIEANFTRYRYPDLAGHLRELERVGTIQRAAVVPAPGARPWSETWWLHRDVLPTLDAVRAAGDAWTGRTTLLSSLDNLIADRRRAERVFGLRFGASPFVPRKRRAEATAVMPVLHGDRFLGRVDARHDRAAGALLVTGLRLEPNAPRSAAMARSVRDALEALARFLHADLRVEAAVPDRWRRTMAG